MRQTDAIIIGAGQAGLAMSHCLGRLGIDHVVLERGRLAERWRSERWDSLRLLTPNWMSRLPGWPYHGADPDGFMTKQEYVSFLEQYACAGSVPAVTGAAVQSVRHIPGGYRVESDRGVWTAPCVVIATGHCDVPLVPEMARRCPASIRQVTPCAYRAPAELPEGGVLVVGASASGLQLAEEIQQSGRQVTISVGRHTRLPRLYRGRDIMWWLDRPGLVGQSTTATDLAAARSYPSMQLVGRPERTSIDLGTLRAFGVRIVGRAADIRDGLLHVNDDLAETVAAAQARLERLLARIDESDAAAGAPREAWPAGLAFEASPDAIDLAANDIRTVVWATGFKRNYRWLHVPVLDAAGEIVHRGGVTPSPGLFVIGLRFLRGWSPSFIDAVGAEANALSADIERHLDETTPCRSITTGGEPCSPTYHTTRWLSVPAVPARPQRC
jgi:putative flavoprotein involved in K+ transport